MSFGHIRVKAYAEVRLILDDILGILSEPINLRNKCRPHTDLLCQPEKSKSAS